MDTMSLHQDQLSLGLALGGGSGGIEDSAAVMKVEVEVNAGGFMAPKPLERLHELGPPPFLTKTFEMVDDPETDPVVSWGGSSSGGSGSGSSFVVWDPHKLSTDLLPKYFRHANFSSFIRQLNTYGFRKVHIDRWEFANAGFQKGKKQLLKTMKRRNHNKHSRLHNLETEMESLKKAHDTFKQEISDLTQQHDNSNESLAAIEDRLRFAQSKQRQFVFFLAKAMKRTSLCPSYKQERVISNVDIRKKRQLASSESSEKGIQMNSSCQNSGLTSDHTTSSPSEFSTGNYIMWDKLMEDDVICDDKELANESIYAYDLENLIEKSPSWWGSLGKQEDLE